MIHFKLLMFHIFQFHHWLRLFENTQCNTQSAANALLHNLFLDWPAKLFFVFLFQCIATGIDIGMDCNLNSMFQMTSCCPVTSCSALGFLLTAQREVCVVLIAQRVRNTCQVCREISEFKTLWVSLLTSLHLKLKAKPLINRAKSELTPCLAG